MRPAPTLIATLFTWASHAAAEGEHMGPHHAELPNAVLSLTLVIALLVGCGGVSAPLGPSVEVPLSPAAIVCRDHRLGEDGACLPGREMERVLAEDPLEVLAIAEAPAGLSAPLKVTVGADDAAFGGRIVVQVKWKQVPEGGEALNNSPRKELAAYAMQKLLFSESQWVVPPTVLRSLPLDAIPGADAYEGTKESFATISYWLQHVTSDRVLDPERWERDHAYRASLIRFNTFTHLIDHRDTRDANFLISLDPKRPRMFAIDNGIAFSGWVQNPIAWFQHDWADLLVPQLDRWLVERLRGLSLERLTEHMGTVAQLERRDGRFVPVELTAPFDAEEGVRDDGRVLQMGLTRDEIEGLHERVSALVEQVGAGELLVP